MDLILHNYQSNQSALMTRFGTDFHHQYGIFGGESQTSFTRNTTRAESEEWRLFLQAYVFFASIFLVLFVFLLGSICEIKRSLGNAKKQSRLLNVCKLNERLLKVLSLAGFYMLEMVFHKWDQVNLYIWHSCVNDSKWYSDTQCWFYQY